MNALLLAILLQSAAEQAKAAAEKTAAAGYAYRVAGRFERTGSWMPEGVLAARIRDFQSARHEDKILVKGPEGLWKTPGERIGEATEKEQRDVADIMKVLEEARAPHRIAFERLAEATKVVEGERVDVDGKTPSRAYWLSFPEKKTRDELQEQLDLDVKRGKLDKPDEVVWSQMKGNVMLYARESDGLLVRLVETSSVKITYKKENQRPDEKKYELRLTINISEHGQAKLDLPVEIKERLGLK